MIDENEKNLLSQNKLIYSKGEIKITKSQCELCMYNDSKNINVCVKYPKGKKEKVLNGEVFCSELKIKSIANLDIQNN